MKKCSNFAVSVIFAVLVASMSPVSSQVTTACTATLISSFTPCLNYLTGSTNGGGTPTSECCKALGSLVTGSTECACLIVTGNVPISLPINRTLAITLPKLCKSKSVPLRCQSTAVPLPGPGPVAYAPALPPLPPVAPSSFTPVAVSPSPEATPANQGQRPLVLPSAAVKISHMNSPISLIILVLGTFLLNKF